MVAREGPKSGPKWQQTAVQGGRPRPSLRIRNRSISGSKATESWRWPAVVPCAKGQHLQNADRDPLGAHGHTQG